MKYNIYKKGVSFLTITLLSLIISSCSDDLLEKDPITELDSNKALQTETDYEALVMSGYDAFQWQVINGPQTHIYPVMWQDMRADNTVSQWASFWASGIPLDDFNSINSSNTNIQALWTKWYTAVERANTAIHLINEFDGFQTTGMKDELIAEAKFIRAFAYFEITKMWGDAPLITSFIGSTDDEIYLSKATQAEIYTQIEADLTDALDFLPTKGTKELGRATQGAAHALKAKVHLYQAEYADVISHTEAVIGLGYSLEGNFADNWDLNNEHGVESIFEIGYADGFSNSAFEGSNAVTNQGSSSYQMFGYIFNGSVGGFGNSVPRQSLIDLYDGSDVRLDATFITPNSVLENGPQSCFCNDSDLWIGTDIYGFFWPQGTAAWESKASMRKYLLPQAVAPSLLNNGSSPLNEKVFRFADVLLMHAEASLFASTSTQSGQASFDMVTTRAFGTTLPLTLENLKSERRKELATEGWDRFSDLVRWGDAATSLAFKNFSTGRDEYLPIPQSEIDLVGANILTQNPGY